jgi:hypothetical protein
MIKHPKSGGPPVNVELATLTLTVKYVVLSIGVAVTVKFTVPLAMPRDPS